MYIFQDGKLLPLPEKELEPIAEGEDYEAWFERIGFYRFGSTIIGDPEVENALAIHHRKESIDVSHSYNYVADLTIGDDVITVFLKDVLEQLEWLRYVAPVLQMDLLAKLADSERMAYHIADIMNEEVLSREGRAGLLIDLLARNLNLTEY